MLFINISCETNDVENVNLSQEKQIKATERYYERMQDMANIDIGKTDDYLYETFKKLIKEINLPAKEEEDYLDLSPDKVVKKSCSTIF